ncbi:MAG: PHP domain-containing protein [Chloroflexi bacterium]|nr:PHP domain-containing protein [Chloroflexota bacterium]
MSHTVDLHLHTTASDGRLTPAQLVALVAARGLRVIAVTDHDTTGGLPAAKEAACAYPRLTLIPGVELSTDVPGGEVHVLGYFVDRDNPELESFLARMRDSRVDRGRRMVEKLAALGMPVPWERVLELAKGGSVGRPHIAQTMVEQGHVISIQEAFNKYIGRNGPAYAERDKLTPVDAVRFLARTRALPVLAHPGEISDLDTVLPELKKAGLVGLEVYYNGYTPEQMDGLAKAAAAYDLLPCGGSDYHALGYEGESEPGTAGPPGEVAERLLAMAPAGVKGRR